MGKIRRLEIPVHCPIVILRTSTMQEFQSAKRSRQLQVELVIQSTSAEAITVYDLRWESLNIP